MSLPLGRQLLQPPTSQHDNIETGNMAHQQEARGARARVVAKCVCARLAPTSAVCCAGHALEASCRRQNTLGLTGFYSVTSIKHGNQLELT